MRKQEALRGQAPKGRKKWKPWLKAALIKFWFYGAVYFFVGWGLFLSSTDQLDLTFVLGLVMGAANDIGVNRILRGMETDKKEYHPYMMAPERAFWAFWLNLLYGLLLAFLVAYLYNFVNIALIRLLALPETAVPFGAEPIGFGLIAMTLDVTLIHFVRFVCKKRGKKPDALL